MLAVGLESSVRFFRRGLRAGGCVGMGGASGDVYRTAKRRGVEDKIKKYECRELWQSRVLWRMWRGACVSRALRSRVGKMGRLDDAQETERLGRVHTFRLVVDGGDGRQPVVPSLSENRSLSRRGIQLNGEYPPTTL